MRLRSSLLGIALACAAAGTASAAAPSWPHVDYPCRIHFSVQDATNGFALLPFHRADTGFEAAAFRIFAPPPAETPLPWRILNRTPDRTLVLVQLDRPAPAPVTLTAYAAPAGVPPVDQNPAIQSPFPVAATIHPYRARGIPDTPERLLYLFQNAGRPGRVAPVAGFPPSLPRDDRAALVQFRTCVDCSQNGTTVIRATDPDNPLLLFLDDRMLDRGEGAVEGPAVVSLRLLTAGRGGSSNLRLEWKTPGAAEFVPIPASALVGPSLAAARRIEHLGRTLQPQFEADLQPPYAFRGLTGVFYPVRLQDRSANWLPYPLAQTWSVAGGVLGSNPALATVFSHPGPHAVTLTVGDELGFATSITHTVSWNQAIPRLHTLSAVPFPMPSAWFRSDTLEPALVTLGAWPAHLEIRIEARLRRLDGSEERFVRPIPPTHSPLITRMAACPAGEFDTLEWALVHEGVTLTNGIVAALHPPFPTRPATLAIDRLEDGAGRRLLYVSPRKPSAVPAPPAASSNAPVVLVDDFLSSRSALDASGTPEGFILLLAGVLGEPVRPAPLRDWRDTADLWKPLLKLAEAPALAGFDAPRRVLLAVGGQDFMAGLSPELFERQAAVLSDLLLQAGHAVTWITPPPFPERPEKARLYAIAIRRVAETRRLPVADLYTLFAGAPEGPALFDPLMPGCLSAQGRRLAAQRIADALRKPQGEPELGH